MAFGGEYSNIKVMRGALVEYAEVDQPLMLFFDFNPTSITRNRSISIKSGSAPGTEGGYDFSSKSEAPRASQSVSVNAESFTIKILLDATDRMNIGDPLATQQGIQPELDTLRSMADPKPQGAEGARILTALGQGEGRAFSRVNTASVLLFVWGVQVLPVFLTQTQMEIKDFLPSLLPYRAEVSLTLQIIESNNPFYANELKRQLASSKRSQENSQFSMGGII